MVKQRYKNLPFYIFSISLDDFNTSKEEYIRQFETIREAFRSQGIESPIGIAIASYHPECIDSEDGNDSQIREAQQALCKKYSDLFIGPDTDKLNKALHRPDGVHFSHIGLDAHADGWVKAIKKVR